MNTKELSKLIEKYKRGECSENEKKFLEDFLNSFQNNPGEWNENEMGNMEIVDGKILSEIMRNISGERSYNLKRIFLSTSLLKQAASILFFIALASGILYLSGFFNQSTNHVAWNEKTTSPGEIAKLTLPDGSKVILNADSKLKYPENFNVTKRTVYLEGEAYFEVHHNINKPFIVSTGNLTTTDLGTKFNVSAYPEDNAISVSLVEGKIKVSRDENGRTDNLVVLKPEEQILYNKLDNKGTLGIFDSVEAIGWMDKTYKFNNETLSKVLPKLERAFGAKLKFTDKQFLAQKITAKFENSSLQTVIEVIENLTGLNYKIVKETDGVKEISFFKKDY